MNGTQHELHRDTDYRFARDGAHFGVRVQQVAPESKYRPQLEFESRLLTTAFKPAIRTSEVLGSR